MKLSSYPLALATVSVCFPLAACNSARDDAEAAVRQALKDPGSATFGEFYYNNKTGRACLTVNAKNAFGGYTGDKQAAFVTDGKDWMYASSAEMSHETCRDDFANGTD